MPIPRPLNAGKRQFEFCNVRGDNSRGDALASALDKGITLGRALGSGNIARLASFGGGHHNLKASARQVVAFDEPVR